MKLLSPILVSFVAILLSVQSASAACLTKIPETAAARDRQLRFVKMQFENAIEAEKTYFDLARDAELTSSQSKIMAGIGIAPAFIIGSVGGLVSGLVGGGATHLAIGISSVVGLGIDAVHLFIQLKVLGFTDLEIDELTKEYRARVQATNSSCSYEELHQKLAEARGLIFKNEFNGSQLNHIRDILTLGSLSKKATIDLLAIAALERELLGLELKELAQVKIPATAKDR